MKEPAHIVWFKKDLRLQDHAPLASACAEAPVLALYCFEPALLAQPDVSVGQLLFVHESLQELRVGLARMGLQLYVWHGDVVDALRFIATQITIRSLRSHQETGNWTSYMRDRRVKRWCDQHQVRWIETPQQAVVRCLVNRNRWATHWQDFMNQACAEKPMVARDAALANWPWDLRDDRPRILPVGVDFNVRQSGGRRAAIAELRDFFERRAIDYRGGISSPLNANTACSRLSAYLTFGNLSMRELVQALWRQQELWSESPAVQAQKWSGSLAQFESRLHWHCHFIQKLETEPELEFRNMHRGYDGLRDENPKGEFLDAWLQGETGYPLIDACMKMLQHTGWVNFRMRAMLVSFASYNLWLDWRQFAAPLARLFLDYEPGIHYPQIQMQSGVTGINTLRIYNPIKQAQDQDAQGHFVRRWLPALRHVPALYIFEPWLMPHHEQLKAGCVIGKHFPAPIVDFHFTYQRAKALFTERRSLIKQTQPDTAQQVLHQHGSRRPTKARAKRRKATADATDTAQLILFE